jgi:hypothetical protein
MKGTGTMRFGPFLSMEEKMRKNPIKNEGNFVFSGKMTENFLFVVSAFFTAFLQFLSEKQRLCKSISDSSV